jgi:hypothetical protein
MKRHLVMDLLHGNMTEEVGEWIPTSILPDCSSCKVKVKNQYGEENFAYFYKDRCDWIECYGKQGSHFWDARSHEPLFNVIEWKKVKEHE